MGYRASDECSGRRSEDHYIFGADVADSTPLVVTCDYVSCAFEKRGFLSVLKYVLQPRSPYEHLRTRDGEQGRLTYLRTFLPNLLRTSTYLRTIRICP